MIWELKNKIKKNWENIRSNIIIERQVQEIICSTIFIRAPFSEFIPK